MFHINNKGDSKPCSAKKPETCRFFKNENDTRHYNSLAEARKSAEKIIKTETGATDLLTHAQEHNTNSLLAETIIEPLPETEKYIDKFANGILTEDFGAVDFKTLSSAKKLYRTVLQGEIPEKIDTILQGYNSSNSIIALSLHSRLADAGYFGRVTKNFSDDIAKNVGNGTVLDLMAGRGFLVKGLREAGVKTIGTDDNSWNLSETVENLDAVESLKKYGDKVSHVVISWAPLGSEIDANILETVRKDYPHITIINIGESHGGATGSEKFWEMANIVKPKHPVRYDTTYGLSDTVSFTK